MIWPRLAILRLIPWAAALCMAVTIGSAPAAADMQSAVEAYRKGEFDAAFEEFKKLAQEGNPRAQFNLGIMYLSGRGTPQDMTEAAKWHRKAADQGLAVAQHGLGVMYYRGDGVTQDFIEAAKWFRRAAEQDLANSQFNLGVMHFNGQGVRKDALEVVKWISLAAANGQKDAMFRLAMMYEEGSLFAKDKAEALRWYRRAARSGRDDATERAEALAKELGEAGVEIAPESPRTGAPETGSDDKTDGSHTLSMPDEEGVESSKPAATASQRENGRESAKEMQRTKEEAPPTATAEQKQTAASQDKDNTRSWRVQLAAFRTEEEAETSWRRLKSRYGDLLGDLTPFIRSAELERGTYRRLQAGPLESREAAFALCNSLKSRTASQGCIPIPPGR